jgi:hypothetical protein
VTTALEEILAGNEALRPAQVSVPYTYWGLGYTDRGTYLAAEKDGHLDDLITNHSPKFLPCLRTGTEALLAGALAWLAP